MSEPTLEQALILGGAMVGWLPASAAVLTVIDAVAYSPALTIYQKAFDNPENKSMKELYCDNFCRFFTEEKKE